MFKKVVATILGAMVLQVECGRIVGGKPAKEGEIPFQVSLRRSYNDAHFCGGTIITPKHILTAAHCMYYAWGGVLPPLVVSVVAGQLDLPILENGIYRNASQIIINDGFSLSSYKNDIAIVELDRELPLDGALITTIPLRTSSVSSGKCVVSGWGHTDARMCNQPPESEIISDVLLKTEVNLFEFSTCSEKYVGQLEDGMMCAGVEEDGTDACQGDSGGPLTCDGLLTGVVSTGCGCAMAEFPGIYTDVAEFIPWIQEKIPEYNFLPNSTTGAPVKEETTTSKPTKDKNSSRVIDLGKVFQTIDNQRNDTTALRVGTLSFVLLCFFLNVSNLL